MTHRPRDARPLRHLGKDEGELPIGWTVAWTSAAGTGSLKVRTSTLSTPSVSP